MDEPTSAGSPAEPPRHRPHPVDARVERATEHRNRLTTAFRIVLAIPHLILVGGPASMWMAGGTAGEEGTGAATGGGGILGLAVFVVTVIAWVVLVVTARHPQALWRFGAFYLRWRVRAVAYLTLLRDEYPPFGDGPYPAALEIERVEAPRSRLTVAVRLILAFPHLLALWVLGIAWFVTTVIAWFAILLTGRFPEVLYDFGVGVLRWSTRVEAYLLLLRDEYPPFRMGV